MSILQEKTKIAIDCKTTITRAMINAPGFSRNVWQPALFQFTNRHYEYLSFIDLPLKDMLSCFRGDRARIVSAKQASGTSRHFKTVIKIIFANHKEEQTTQTSMLANIVLTAR